MAWLDPDDYWQQQGYVHRLPDGNLYAEVPDVCPACGMSIPATDEGILDHAAHHVAEYEKFFVWPVFVYEDALDAEFLNDEDRLNEQ